MARKAKSASFDPATFLATVNHGRTLAEYRTEQVIFSQGDAADFVFYIVRGKIKIVVTSEQGREAVVGLFGEGDFFGEGCLIAQPLRLATAAAMTDSTVMRLEKAEMIRVLHVEPAFAEMFTAHLLTRNSRIEADLVDHLFNSSERRLARTLLLLGEFRQGGKAGAYHHKNQPGDTRGDGWDDPAARELLHEQIQEARLYRLQWGTEGPQFVVERRSARLARLGCRRTFFRRCGQY